MSYDKIEIYGPSVIDKLKIMNRVLTGSEIEALGYDDELIWDEDTLLLAEYTQTLEAGTVIGLVNPPTKWEIYRKSSTESIYTKIAELEMGDLSFYDYAAAAQEEYEYRIYAVNDTERSAALQTESVVADFYNWALISPEDDIVYIFKSNAESSQIEVNDDVTISNNLRRKFPTVTFDEREYISGSLNAYVGNISIDGTKTYSVDFLETLKAFINNKKEKILKSPNGDVWKVVTHKFDWKYYDEVYNMATKTQPAMISFEFVETTDDLVRYE